MRALERLHGFVQNAACADSIPALKELIRVEIIKLGFDRFSYMVLRHPKGRPGRLYFGTFPAGWSQYYDDEGLSLHDPIMRHPFHTMQPFRWDEIGREERDRNSEILVFGPAADAGLRYGAAVPIHGPSGSVALLSVSKDCGEGDFHGLFAESRFDLQIVAYAAHDTVLRLMAIEKLNQPAQLTRRQKEVLLWTIHGKTNWEIGEILDISEDTVRQHLRLVCRLLGATNRTHAATIAVNRNLISPDSGMAYSVKNT